MSTKAVSEIKGGKIEFRVDRHANLHFIIGKVSFSEQALAENYARRPGRGAPAQAVGGQGPLRAEGHAVHDDGTGHPARPDEDQGHRRGSCRRLTARPLGQADDPPFTIRRNAVTWSDAVIWRRRPLPRTLTRQKTAGLAIIQSQRRLRVMRAARAGVTTATAFTSWSTPRACAGAFRMSGIHRRTPDRVEGVPWRRSDKSAAVAELADELPRLHGRRADRVPRPHRRPADGATPGARWQRDLRGGEEHPHQDRRHRGRHRRLDEHLVGPSAIAFVKGDPVEAAKGLRDFAKAHPVLVIKGGYSTASSSRPTRSASSPTWSPARYCSPRWPGR